MTHPDTEGYDTVARVFHWLIALLVFVQIPAGIAMTTEQFPRSVGDTLFILHKGLGSVLLVVIAARVVWRLLHPVPALLSHVPALQRRMAGVIHAIIYVVLLTLPVSGYIRTVGDGYPIELLDALGVPPLVTDIPEIAHVMLVVHKFSAYLLTALIAAHIGAVVHQKFIVRDRVMSRMWPPVRRALRD